MNVLEEKAALYLLKFSLPGVPLENVVRFKTDESVERFITIKRQTVPAVWIGSDVKAPVFRFWQLVWHACLSATTPVIFTGIDPTKPEWRDLSDYEYVVFGRTCLLVFSANTRPMVRPSQRGIFLQ